MRPAENILRSGGKEKNRGANLSYIVSAFANVTMYPQYNNMLIKKQSKKERKC
jgi:hypothetical protein